MVVVMTQEEKRKLKYPETAYFHYHNQNPKKKITADCTHRALSTALELPYEQVVRELAEIQIKTGYEATEKRCINSYLESKGWKMQACLKHVDNKKFDGEEFCSWLMRSNKKYDKVVLNIGSEHITCAINYKIWDIWNCSEGKVGNWWVKV